MTYIFPERRKIDKAQFILDGSGLVLKTCKIPTASLNCKILHFFSLSFSEAAHAYSFYTKNFEILTKYSDSLAENLRCAKFYGHTTHNYPTMAKIRGPMPCWTESLIPARAWIIYEWMGETRSRDVWKPVSNRTPGVISKICKLGGGTPVLFRPVGTLQDFALLDMGKNDSSSIK